MKIEVYESQVGKPVQEVVKDPGLSVAGGIGALGQGLAQGALAVGEVVQAVQRRSEYDTAVNGAARDVSDYFEEMRQNPIYPGVNDVNADGSPVDVMRLREDSWENKRKEIEEAHFGGLSHARARDDVNTWWAQASEKVRSDVANNAITESLQYHGKLRGKMIDDHIQDRDFESAGVDVEYGLQNGFWDRSGAEDLYTHIETQERWLTNRDTVYDAFNASGGGLEGLGAAYTAINTSSLTDEEKATLNTEIEGYENDQFRLQRRRETDDLGGVASGLHKGLYTGDTTRAMILADPGLDYAWDGGRTRDWLLREEAGLNSSGSGSGSDDDWALVPSSLKELWKDRYVTQDKFDQAVQSAFGRGDISYGTKTFLEKLKREGILETNVAEEFATVDDFYDSRIADAETPEDKARLEGLKTEIMDNLHNVLFNNRSEMTDERVAEAIKKSMVMYFSEELELKRAGGIYNFFGPAVLDDHEKILQAWQDGNFRDLESLGFVQDTMKVFTKISTGIIEDYGITDVTSVPFKGGLEFEGTSPDGTPGYFRLYVPPGKKEDILQQGYRNDKGEIVWLTSDLARKEPSNIPSSPAPPGLPDIATPPEDFEEASARAEQKNIWAVEWEEFNRAHGLGVDASQIARQAESGGPPEGWRDSLNATAYPEEYIIYPESEARAMARDRGNLGQFDQQWREAKIQAGRDEISKRENNIFGALPTWAWFRRRMENKYYVSEELARDIYYNVLSVDQESGGMQ